MSDEVTHGSSLHQKLKVAMAVAIAARKHVDRSSSTDWKEKALRARSSLMKVSRTLKASDIGPSTAVQAAVARIAEFEQDSMPMDQVQEPHRLGDSIDEVRDKSNQLSSFVEAVGALNTVLDMRDGKLCRIWDTNPMKQLGNCLCDSLLGLPDSPMTDKALQSACMGILHVAREGCSHHDIEALCDRLLQSTFVASHPFLAIDLPSRSLDGVPDCQAQTTMCRPRLPLLQAVLASLSEDAHIGSVLLAQATKVLSWLLDVVNTGGMPRMGFPVCNLARRKLKPKDTVDQQQVSTIIESLIELCKTSHDRLRLFPALRDLMRQLLCTVTAALQAQMEHARSHKMRVGPESMTAKHLALCRDLLLQGSTVLPSTEVEED